MAFSGFDSKEPGVVVPAQLFSKLLAQIDDLAELKLLLYLLRQQSMREAAFAYFRRDELAADESFMHGLADTPEEQAAALDAALDRSIRRGTLLAAEHSAGRVYVVHSSLGRAALKGLAEGKWEPEVLPGRAEEASLPRPNIFELYEQNIGPLTPMLAESLREAEAAYPMDWIEDAVRIALENNVRKWRYVDAILRSWQEKGRDERKDQRDSEKDQRKYVEGEFSDFIER